VSDAEIKISSFQARKRNGDPTYVSVVVPYSTAGIELQLITDRANGDIVIDLGYEIDGAIALREEILRVTLDEIRDDKGGSSRSLSLSGHKTESFIGQVSTVNDPIYRSLQSNNRVFRFAEIDPYLKPGDTCIVGSDEFTVDYIVYMVNEYQTFMEVREGQV
jgi:hypothetical protein